MKLRLLLLAGFLAAGCSPEEPAVKTPGKPVVVYAAHEHENELGQLLEQFRKDTGNIVITRYGDPDEIVGDVVRNDISPPADILFAASVMGIWRAAEDGALRPIHSDIVDQSIPAWARDPDGLWSGLGFDPAVIVAVDTEPSDDYAALAGNRYSNRLCLSAFANPVNQIIIAMLIESQGLRPAELAVREWIKNLALPPLATEEKLVAALDEGRCKIGVVSESVAAVSGLAWHTPPTVYGDVDPVGIARHARNPEGALQLIEWLIEKETGGRFANLRNASHKNAGVAAWYYEDAARLAERAGYR